MPKAVKEEEFWRNYFYRVSLIKQSFELKDLEEDQKKNAKEAKKDSKVADVSDDLDVG